MRRDELERETLLGELAGGSPVTTQPVGGAMPGPSGGGTPGLGAFTPGVMPPEGAAQKALGKAASGIGARQALGGYSQGGTMLGFNTAMNYGDDKAANSVKNTFGRIASRYANRPSSIDAILADADFQRFFPGAKKVEGGAGDKIDFGGVLSDFESGVPVGIVDVLGSADPSNDSSAGWTWQDEANDGGGGGGGNAAMGGGGIEALLGAGEAATSPDRMQEILRAIQALSEGQDPSRDALLQELGR